MPLPESHLESLERHLRIHDEQIAALHASREAITREIRRREEVERGEPSDPNAKVGGIPVLVAQREVIEREIGIHEALVAGELVAVSSHSELRTRDRRGLLPPKIHRSERTSFRHIP
jgi:hypothetical protein